MELLDSVFMLVGIERRRVILQGRKDAIAGLNWRVERIINMKGLFGTLRITDELPALYRYARVLTRDEPAAEDLVHDALLRAYEKRHSFRPGASSRPWLFAIMHNLFVSGWRKSKAERKRNEQAANHRTDVAPPSQEHALRLRAVSEAFEELSDEHRAVLHLVVVEGHSYHTAAETLGVPIGTLISRLSRARAALREGERLPRSTRHNATLRLVRSEKP